MIKMMMAVDMVNIRKKVEKSLFQSDKIVLMKIEGWYERWIEYCSVKASLRGSIQFEIIRIWFLIIGKDYPS